MKNMNACVYLIANMQQMRIIHKLINVINEIDFCLEVNKQYLLTLHIRANQS